MDKTNRTTEPVETGIPDTEPLADDHIGSDLADLDQRLRGRGADGALHTANIGRAWNGTIKSANLGDDGSLGEEGNIDTSGTGPAGVPDLGNLDPAGTGNAGYTGDNVAPTELDRARK